MISDKKQSVVIVAGGKGFRAGGELPKQFMTVGGKPMLMHTIQSFYNFDNGMQIIVVLPEGYQLFWDELCEKHQFNLIHQVTTGGESRFQSVKNGLKEIRNEGIVGIHDAARPFITSELISRCYTESRQYHCGAVPVVDEVNSVRKLTENGSIMVDREQLKIVQTPQVFPAGIIKKAYKTDYQPSFTDDASVAEKSGIIIRLVEGEEANIKITTPLDLIFAERYFQYLSKR